MESSIENAVLRHIAKTEGLDPSALFVCDGVVYRLTGEDVTGTVCQLDTPYWKTAVQAVSDNQTAP